MKMKISCLVAVMVYTLTVSVAGRDIFALRTALTTSAATQASCTISMGADEVLEFSARDMERRLLLEEGALGGITVTALPVLSQGGLYLDGVEVETYEFIDRDGLDRLCFVAADSASGASMTFLPQSRDAVTTSLNIQILAASNEPPEIQDAVCETTANVARTGFINAWDPDGGAVTLQLSRKPQKGTVVFKGLQFTYTPYKDMTGSDSFAVCAVDENSAYSREGTVNVQIESVKQSVVYADMQQNPSNYAAVKLKETGIFTGVVRGEVQLFLPDQRMTRGEYVLLLLSAKGVTNVPAAVNTGLPNDDRIPMWLKPYVKAAADAGIIPADQNFNYNEIPTRAEAVLMCDRAADITDVKEYALEMPDAADIPDWALPSYKDLAAYRMLDLYDGNAHPDRALDNSYAADLIWQLYKHAHR